MSRLTEVLDRLFENLAWQGEPVERLNPGLSREEIDVLMAPLPFRLPPEVYELYQWRNGSDCPFWRSEDVYLMPECSMLPLGRAVEWLRQFLEHEQRVLQSVYPYVADLTEPAPVLWRPEDYPRRLLPILTTGNVWDYRVQVILGKAAAGIPGTVVHSPNDENESSEDERDESQFAACVARCVSDSLLGFFTATVECWEKGIYAINPDPRHDWDNFRVNAAEQNRVFQKYRHLV